MKRLISLAVVAAAGAAVGVYAATKKSAVVRLRVAEMSRLAKSIAYQAKELVVDTYNVSKAMTEAKISEMLDDCDDSDCYDDFDEFRENEDYGENCPYSDDCDEPCMDCKHNFRNCNYCPLADICTAESVKLCVLCDCYKTNCKRCPIAGERCFISRLVSKIKEVEDEDVDDDVDDEGSCETCIHQKVCSHPKNTGANPTAKDREASFEEIEAIMTIVSKLAEGMWPKDSTKKP